MSKKREKRDTLAHSAVADHQQLEEEVVSSFSRHCDLLACLLLFADF